MGGSWCLSCVYYPVCNKVAIEVLIVGFQILSEVIYSWGYRVGYMGGGAEGMGVTKSENQRWLVLQPLSEIRRKNQGAESREM